MREALVRGRYVVACAIVLSAVVTADAREAAPARTADGDARPRVAAAQRERRERPLPRVIRLVVRSLTDGLILPRP